MKKFSQFVEGWRMTIGVRRTERRKGAASNRTTPSVVFNLAIVVITTVLCVILWILLTT